MEKFDLYDESGQRKCLIKYDVQPLLEVIVDGYK